MGEFRGEESALLSRWLRRILSYRKTDAYKRNNPTAAQTTMCVTAKFCNINYTKNRSIKKLCLSRALDAILAQ